MDVRALLNVFERQVEDDDGDLVVEQEITDPKIEQHIQNADAVIWGYLNGIYGDTLSAETPYFAGPIAVAENTSSIALRGVIVAATAITEQWLVKFTAENTFEVIGTVSGAQGNGTILTDFTSTNAAIQIAAEDWTLGKDVAVDVGNQILFGTYTSHKLVRTLSAKLAASDLIDALYSNASDEQSGFSRALRKQVMDLLKALVDPKSDVSLTSVTEDDIEDEAVAWSIDKYGNDLTNYGTYVDDDNPMDI